ncbi:hypothetical protein D3C71_1884420 [compost metagenome]
MPPRADFSGPAAAGNVHAAAEHFVHIAHGEGDVVQAGARGGQLQHEQIVVTAFFSGAQERAAIRIAV